MGAFNVNMPDDFLDRYNFKEEELVDAVASASPILEDSMKKSIQSVLGHSGDSAMINSVKRNKPVKTRTDAIESWVGPSGIDSKGRKKPIRNIEKAVYLNYGTVKQPARPWLAKSINDSESLIQQKLQDKLEERLNR